MRCRAWALQADREVVPAAVGQSVHASRYAAKALQADREVVLAAVGQNLHALRYAAEALQADQEIVLAAVGLKVHVLRGAAKALQVDRESSSQPSARIFSPRQGPVHLKVPAYLTRWQDIVDLLLAPFLLFTPAPEPTLHCTNGAAPEPVLPRMSGDGRPDVLHELQVIVVLVLVCLLVASAVLVLGASRWSRPRRSRSCTA